MANELRFLLAEAITASAAAMCAVLVSHHWPKPPQAVPPHEVLLPAGQYFSNPSERPIESRLALEYSLTHGDLVVLGSSELTTKSTVALQRFYPAACGRRVLSIGRAGFQCLSILTLLADVRRALSPRSRIVIILSAGWFGERGNPSDAYLRFLNPHEIIRLARQSNLPAAVRGSILREVRSRRDEFTGLYPDWLFLAAPRLAAWATTDISPDLSAVRVTAEPPPRLASAFDWAEAERQAREEQQRATGGNPLGTTQEYYDHIKKKHPPFPPPKLDLWETEKKTLLALSAFLREQGVKAEFILEPLHRRVFKALQGYDQLFEELRQHLLADGHAWKTEFVEPYDLSVLQDATHFSDSAWVRIQHEECLR